MEAAPGTLAGFLLTEAGKEGLPPATTILIVLGMSVAILLILRLSQRSRPPEGARKRMPDAARSEASREPSGSRGPQEPDAAGLSLELSEFAREMEGRIDMKVAYLRRLIDQAEKVLLDLNRSIAAAEAVREGEREKLAAEVPSAEDNPSDPGDVGEGQRAPRIDITVDGPVQVASGPSPGSESLLARVLQLAGEGKPKEEIAEAVGIPQGEVELVLSLYGNHPGQGEGNQRPGNRALST